MSLASSSPPTSPSGIPVSPWLPRAALGGGFGVAFRSACSTGLPSSATYHVTTECEDENDVSFLMKEGTRHGDLLHFFVSGSSFRSAYTEIKQIGQGGFGKVFQMENKELRIQRAVKRLKKTNATCEMNRNELDALLALDHPHIVKLVEYYDQEDKYLYFVFELCTGPDLLTFIRSQDGGRLSERDASVALRHMLKAVQCCHANYTGHFDIKPENFMYATPNLHNLKMIDLGLSSSFGRNKAKKGTDAYMAPECWDNIYGPEADVWSCGVVLYVMLTGKHFLSDAPPVEKKRETRVRGRMKYELHDAEREYELSEQCMDLLRQMLQHNRHARPSVKECLKHPFITGGYHFENDPDLQSRFPVKQALDLLNRLPEVFREAVQEPMLKRVSRLVLAHFAPPCKPERLVFRMLDKYGCGEVSIADWEQDVEARSASIPDDIETLFEKVSLFRCNSISSLELLAATLPAEICNDSKLCTVAFNIMDKGKDGFIDANDIAELFGHEEGSLICQNVVAEVCPDACSDKRLSLENFVQLMRTD